MSLVEREINNIVRTAWKADEGRPPPSTVVWFDACVVRLWREAARFAGTPSGDCARKQAAGLAVEGRDRLLRFIDEYQIAQRIPKLGTPVDSLIKNRITITARSNYDWLHTDARVEGRPGALPWFDHPHSWRDRDGMLVLTSNPYCTEAGLTAVCPAFAAREGLRVDIRPDLDFYSAGGQGTPLVIWRKQIEPVVATAKKDDA